MLKEFTPVVQELVSKEDLHPCQVLVWQVIHPIAVCMVKRGIQTVLGFMGNHTGLICTKISPVGCMVKPIQNMPMV